MDVSSSIAGAAGSSTVSDSVVIGVGADATTITGGAVATQAKQNVLLHVAAIMEEIGVDIEHDFDAVLAAVKAWL